MKRYLHLLFLIFTVLLAAGVVFVVISPTARKNGRANPPPPTPPDCRVTLVLGGGPAGWAERASLREFGFGETIYATALIDGLPPGEHLLIFRWINPQGRVQEKFRRTFYSRGGRYRGWSWLELRGEEWLPFPLGPLGPGRFLGSWRMEILLDGSVVARAGFTVR